MIQRYMHVQVCMQIMCACMRVHRTHKTDVCLSDATRQGKELTFIRMQDVHACINTSNASRQTDIHMDMHPKQTHIMISYIYIYNIPYGKIHYIQLSKDEVLRNVKGEEPCALFVLLRGEVSVYGMSKKEEVRTGLGKVYMRSDQNSCECADRFDLAHRLRTQARSASVCNN
jgi:hypothetical protein